MNAVKGDNMLPSHKQDGVERYVSLARVDLALRQFSAALTTCSIQRDRLYFSLREGIR